ncbi:helix-turn-helix transcriptional regulator [Streptomyces actinomycinicus]|uniref:Helix-turn-helix transcriptional regulator n=1 Tax=Streptomyces actinomycinicus TaxID=1695166 RepID=A0A937EJL6_9ACTN|nr:helix-turn-helix transcriptional regulator [Streptomyces actinomycinicus]MBL1083582.1 helix-turn-helix transcriptional regulator [Streptomyces actinomycinicus]
MIVSNSAVGTAPANESAEHRLSSVTVADPPPHQPPGNAPTKRCTHWAVTAAAIPYWAAANAEAAHRKPGVSTPVADAHWAGLLLLDGCAPAAPSAREKGPRDRHVPDGAIRPAVTTVVVAASPAGWFDKASAAVDRPDPGRPWFAEIGYAHCFALLMAGQMPGSYRTAENGYRDEVAAGNIAVAEGWLAPRGQVADVATAIADAETASLLFNGGNPRLALAPRLAELAVFGDQAGTQQPRHLTDRAPRSRLFVPWSTLSQAWTTAADGNTTLAARQALSAADAAMALGQDAVEATASYDVARLGSPNAVRHRLAALANLVPGPVVPAMAGAAAALARSDPGGLDVATAKFNELGMDLLAAETATAAAALRHTSTPPSTIACPTATTPLLQLTAPLVDLTSRERDVALLAANGFTSPAIGHRLGLSARTVDNHLGRAYQKLGVTGRRDLAPLVIGDRPQSPIHAEGNQR